MIRWVVKGLLATAGSIVGVSLIILLSNNAVIDLGGNLISLVAVYVIAAILGAMLIYSIVVGVFSYIQKRFIYIENKLKKITLQEIIIASFGLIIGLIIANLISIPILKVSTLGVVISFVLNLLFGYYGINIFLNKKDEFKSDAFMLKKAVTKQHGPYLQPKILDTSVIIDGRIADICQTGFIEGELIIPSFVLRELQHIADSSDGLKRNRGRRGLDVLNLIQKELKIPVKILDKDFEGIAEVDSKLLKLAEIMNGIVITNDYNLNKVASFHGVSVFNINELANAVKPIVLPGEYMFIQVVKDGKENGQGIAYLDDGTMIVVDGGKKHIGESIDVIVTSVLQTPAGRMIFVKPKYEVEKAG